MRLLTLIVVLLSFVLASSKSYGQLLGKNELTTAYLYTSLDEALAQPDKVIKLELKRQKLDSFPKEILQFKNLQWLSLRNNKLTEFPRELVELKKLQELDLSKNKIDTIYKEIGKLKNLYYLNMNNNNIVTLPPEIGQLTKLEILDLWSNYIEDFPAELNQLVNLKELDLRLVSLNDDDHKYIYSLLPNTKIHFSHSCNCNQ